MTLSVSIGQSSATGVRSHNEDFHGAATPVDEQLATKGILVAVADGVGGHAGGREAAEMTVRGLLSDYYATPETWSVPHALNQVLSPLNAWVRSHAARHRDMAGMATTLSLLALHGNRYTVGHVGDSRVYRLHSGELQTLTTDHVWDMADMRQVLKRAVGLDSQLRMDYLEGDLECGDTFALMSDGVWEPLGHESIQNILQHYQNPQRAADEMVKRALSRGGQDNATAVVVRVEQTGAARLTDLINEATRLKPPPRLKPGQLIDHFEVLELLHESRASLLYRVRNTINGQPCVLKTLQPLMAHDLQSCAALLQEEWLGRRVVSRYFTQVLPLTQGQRSSLYYVMSWHPGATLQQKLDAGYYFTVSETAELGLQLIRGLGALHRLNILHRDLKPANLHLGDDGRLRILDLGVSQSLNLPTHEPSGSPGTPSFMAPEQIAGAQASAQTDLYAAGVTLYHVLTRHYPYGEIEPFQHPHFGQPVSPLRYRPDIPQWLENILLKSVALDPAQRFETAEELALALEAGESKPILPPRPAALMDDPLRLWQWIAVASITINLLLIYLWLATK
jgi:protein phosphatase